MCAEYQRELSVHILLLCSKISTTQRQISQQESNANFREIISLDSDDDDFSVTISKSSKDDGFQTLSSSHASSVEQANGTASHAHQTDKGERIMLKIRSNGGRTDEVPIHMVRFHFRIDALILEETWW